MTMATSTMLQRISLTALSAVRHHCTRLVLGETESQYLEVVFLEVKCASLAVVNMNLSSAMRDRANVVLTATCFLIGLLFDGNSRHLLGSIVYLADECLQDRCHCHHHAEFPQVRRCDDETSRLSQLDDCSACGDPIIHLMNGLLPLTISAVRL